MLDGTDPQNEDVTVGNSLLIRVTKLMKFIRSLLLVAVLFAGLCPAVLGAPLFTITPNVVSNTYAGTITLQITGLTSGDTVVVQKFLDANTNGIIDGGDGVVQQFNLTDGQAGMVIGGITNNNVPGDTDGAANGQITAKLNFPNGDFIQNLVGNYLYKFSSPVGHFTPQTNNFNVTNFPFGQKFFGNVVSNSSSTTLPNAVVLLFPPPRAGHNGPGGNPVAGMVANSAGAYTVQAPPGTYTLVALATNYVGNFKKAPVLTLGSGQTINTNLSATNATASITGKVVDAANNAIGLPGVFLPLQSTNGLLAFSYSDTNGNFTARVTAGQWALGSDDSGLIIHGYVGWNNDTNVNSGAAGVTLAYAKANALFYGSVKDSLGNPLVGIDVNDNDTSSYLYAMDGYTDANGNYFVGALGLGGSDPWQVAVGGKTSLTNYIFSQPAFDQNGGTNLNAGQSVLANLSTLLATNYITGNVKAGGTNIVGVGVWANVTINNLDFSTYADTDASGNYSFNVGNGGWSVGVNYNGGSDSLDNILGAGTYQPPANQNVNINNNNATNNFTVQPCGGVQIFTTNLPDGQMGVFYGLTLQGSTCSGQLNWTLNDPQDFPTSLGFSQNGAIQGTPDTSGPYNFSVQLDDGNGHSTNQNLSLYIAPASTPLAVTTTSLPNGTNGTFYSQTIQASGGQTPYSWSIPNYSADPPPNLTLATNGVLSGTLTTAGGPFSFDVTVTDGATNTAYQTLSVYIVNPPLPPLVITNVSLPNGNVGEAYSAQLGATGGQSPYNWQLATGSANPPAGLTLYSSGLISGTPTTNKVSTFKVQATDANFVTTNKVLSITINSKPVLGSASWLTNQFQMRLTGASNQIYTVQMSTNLSSTNWISLFITNNTTTNSFLLTDPNATNQQRYYRILIGQ
jgi:hypothetical protein